jgi:hypothetical protein
MSDTTPRHRPGCARPEPTVKIVSGRYQRLSCDGCGRFWWPNGQPRPATPRTDAPVTEVTPDVDTETAQASRYVCRDHYAPVRPNGRGCVVCAQERAAS